MKVCLHYMLEMMSSRNLLDVDDVTVGNVAERALSFSMTHGGAAYCFRQCSNTKKVIYQVAYL